MTNKQECSSTLRKADFFRGGKIMRKILCIVLSAVFAAAAVFTAGCAGKPKPRVRVTSFDAAVGEARRPELPTAQNADGTSYALLADVNISALGKKIGSFKAAKSPEGMEYANLERYDGCDMYAVLDYPPEECFILDNGGQYLLAVRIGADAPSGAAGGAEAALREKQLVNFCVRIGGRLYCSVAAVKLSSCGSECAAAIESSETELIINGVRICAADAAGFLFGDHPAKECIILSDGRGAILLASTEYLSENILSLIGEVQNGDHLF